MVELLCFIAVVCSLVFIQHYAVHRCFRPRAHILSCLLLLAALTFIWVWVFQRSTALWVASLFVALAVCGLRQALGPAKRDEPPWHRRSLVPFFVLVVCAACTFAGLAVLGELRMFRAARHGRLLGQMERDLMVLREALDQYASTHDQHYPASVKTLVAGGYGLPLPSDRWESFELVYRSLDLDAGASDVRAYSWPPCGGRVAMLFADGAISRAPVEEGGSLLNPRSGEVVRAARAGNDTE